MRLRCSITQTPGGWSIRHASEDLGTVATTAATREQALEKMRGELRYRLELCPCSGESYQHVELELVE